MRRTSKDKCNPPLTRYEERETTLELSARERTRSSFLIVESDNTEREQMRHALVSLSYKKIFSVGDHFAGLNFLEQQNVTHVIFNACKTNIPSTEFASRALQMDPRMVLIPASYQPRVDDVWRLLQLGSRGYLAKPYNLSTLDNSIILASKGEALSEQVLGAENRNAAFADLMCHRLDRLTTVMRHLRNKLCTKHDLVHAEKRFRESVDLAHTFAEGSELDLLGAIVDVFTHRAEGPATRLGRLRKRLKGKREGAETQNITEPVGAREQADPENESDDSDTGGVITL